MEKLLKKYREIIVYLFWGVCTTIVSWVSYAIFVKTMGMSVAVGNALSWILAVLFAFVVNKVRVFRSKSWKPSVVSKEFGMFLSARVITGIFEIVAVPLLVNLGLDQQILGVKGALAKFLCTFVVTVLNYVFSKLWIFK